jgi:hypothetical protein
MTQAETIAERLIAQLRPYVCVSDSWIRTILMQELEPKPVPISKDEEKKLRASQRTKVLSALKAAGLRGCMNTELTQICLRYGARLKELRDKGYKIRTERVSVSEYNFVLEGVTHG